MYIFTYSGKWRIDGQVRMMGREEDFKTVKIAFKKGISVVNHSP